MRLANRKSSSSIKPSAQPARLLYRLLLGVAVTTSVFWRNSPAYGGDIVTSLLGPRVPFEEPPPATPWMQNVQLFHGSNTPGLDYLLAPLSGPSYDVDSRTGRRRIYATEELSEAVQYSSRFQSKERPYRVIYVLDPAGFRGGYRNGTEYASTCAGRIRQELRFPPHATDAQMRAALEAYRDRETGALNFPPGRVLMPSVPPPPTARSLLTRSMNVTRYADRGMLLADSTLLVASSVPRAMTAPVEAWNESETPTEGVVMSSGTYGLALAPVSVGLSGAGAALGETTFVGGGLVAGGTVVGTTALASGTLALSTGATRGIDYLTGNRISTGISTVGVAIYDTVGGAASSVYNCENRFDYSWTRDLARMTWRGGGGFWGH